MAFKVFTQEEAKAARVVRQRSVGTKTRISISKNGVLEINPACMRGGFQGFQFVQLFYDAETRQIALKPATMDDEHTRKISPNKVHGGYFSATPFLKHHHVPFEKTYNHPVEWLDELGAYVFKLDDDQLTEEKLDEVSFLLKISHPIAFSIFPQSEILAEKNCIRILKKGGLDFNVTCMETHFKDVGFAQLFYDSQHGRIAVKRATAEDQHTYRITRSKASRGYLTGVAFLRYYGILVEEPVRYTAEWLKDMEAYVIRLDEYETDGKPDPSHNSQERSLADFELFTQRNVPVPADFRISITKYGIIYLSAICLKNQFREVQFAQLFYDSDKRLIAVKPATANDGHTFKINMTKQAGANIAGQSFLKHHEIHFEKTHSFAVEWVDDPGALVINLNDYQANE